MVVDCSIIVTVQPTAKLGTEEQKSEELLFPERHKITLPLNGLNMLFSTCETAFNHSTQVATDRYGLLAKTLCNTDGSPKNHALIILFSAISSLILMASATFLPWNKILTRTL